MGIDIKIMESHLVDVEKHVYLETLLKQDIYKEYFSSLYELVSKTDENNNKISLRKVIDVIRSASQDSKGGMGSNVLPILIYSEAKKRYLFDALKMKFKQRMILVPMCPLQVRIYHHVLNCLIEDIGLELFERVDLTPYQSTDNDAIKALRIYQQDATNKPLIERWLYEDELLEKEKNALGLGTNIGQDVNCLALIRVICDSFKEKFLLFFDEIETINQEYGKQYGIKTGERAEIVYLDNINSLSNNLKNVIILIPCVKTSWNGVLKYSSYKFRSILESKSLEFFDLEEIKRKITKVMNFYWLQNKIRPPSDPLFPLSDNLLESLFEQAGGNIKLFFNLLLARIQTSLSKIIKQDQEH